MNRVWLNKNISKNDERHPYTDSRSHMNSKQDKILKYMVVKLLKTKDSNKILKNNLVLGGNNSDYLQKNNITPQLIYQ